MRIKVITQHYSPTKVYDEIRYIYDYDQTFMFDWDDNILKEEGTAWFISVTSLEEVFNKIYAKFKNTNYKIVDLIQLL